MTTINTDWNRAWTASAYQKAYLVTEVKGTCFLYYYDQIHIGEEENTAELCSCKLLHFY